MNTDEHKPPHENEAEPTAVRFDDGAMRTARPVVPLDRDSLDAASRRSGKWPLGLILGLGLVTVAAALAGTLYREERPQATTAAAAPARETPSTAHLDIAQAAAEAVSQAEPAPESAASESDDVTYEAAAAAGRTRARTSSSSSYADGRVNRYEGDDLEELLGRAERTRKEAEDRAGRRRGRAGSGPPKPRLIGVYTLRSRH